MKNQKCCNYSTVICQLLIFFPSDFTFLRCLTSFFLHRLMDPAAALPFAEAVESGAEGSGAEELDAEEVAQPTLPPMSQGVEAVRPSDRPVRLAAPRESWLFVDQLVDIDCVFFDRDLSQGQIRTIDEDLMRQKRKEFRLEEPLGPIRCLLVAQDLSGMCWDAGYWDMLYPSKLQKHPKKKHAF